MKTFFSLSLLSVFLGAATASAAPASNCSFPGNPTPAAVQLKTVVENLNRPVAMAVTAGYPDSWFIVEQAGKIRRIKNGKLVNEVFLDITDRVTPIGGGGDERGFLGLAFHPDFAKNGRLFVNYTNGTSNLKTRISEFLVTSGRAEKNSEKILLEIKQPYSNHNGGEVRFGPDGYLYLGLGDGGSGGDPEGNGQNLTTLLGKILRLEIGAERGTYKIPQDNPVFAQEPKARREIYAYGLRNPWRFSFDRVTGDLWAADVGQNQFEEIDIIKAGKNYGWNIMEGTHCYDDPSCKKDNLEQPVLEYPHSEGISVTGGFVYRGKKILALVGSYVFGDYGSGMIWSTSYDGKTATAKKTLTKAKGSVVAFGEDLEGELYVLDLSGKISRMTPEGQKDPGTFPKTLKDTKCFSSLSPLTPIEGALPYEVNAPLWSDGLKKNRWLYLPEGQRVPFQQEGGLTFPTGSVLIKNFLLPKVDGSEEIIETRFLVKRADAFEGYSYRWREDGSDADLMGGASTREVTIAAASGGDAFHYYYPSSSDCARCHTKGGGFVLGFQGPQLNHEIDSVNQLTRLAELGAFTPESVPQDPASQVPALPSYRDEGVPIETRARAFLAVQCSSCHNPETNAGQSPYDFRFTTPLADMAVCNRVPHHGDLGASDAKVLKPGAPDESVLYLRIATLDPRHRMPPLATSRLDTVGLAVIREWIARIQQCP